MLFNFSGLLADVYDLMRIVTSADKAYKILHERGLSFTRAEVRSAWREVGTKTSWSRVAATWGLDKKLPRAWIMEGPSGMRSEFQYRYGMLVYNPLTGTEEERFVSRLSQSYVAPAQYMSEAGSELEAYARWEGV